MNIFLETKRNFNILNIEKKTWLNLDLYYYVTFNQFLISQLMRILIEEFLVTIKIFL